MRIAMLVLVLMAFASVAYASDPIFGRARGPVAIPELQRDEFYCQDPDTLLTTVNASTGFGSELVDDVPDEWVGHSIYDIVIYVGMWGGAWLDPVGIIVNFYDWECPPETLYVYTQYHVWGGDLMDVELVYEDPGYYTVYRVTLWKCPPIPITERMSIGFVVDNGWGEAPPYCGLVTTSVNDIYGCGELYWDATYWGYWRWITLSYYVGDPYDLAYCLSENQGPSAVETTTWGSIKDLYK